MSTDIRNHSYDGTPTRRMSAIHQPLPHERSQEELDLAAQLVTHSQAGRVANRSTAPNRRPVPPAEEMLDHSRREVSNEHTDLLSSQPDTAAPAAQQIASEGAQEQTAAARRGTITGDFPVTGQVCRYGRTTA